MNLVLFIIVSVIAVTLVLLGRKMHLRTKEEEAKEYTHGIWVCIERMQWRQSFSTAEETNEKDYLLLARPEERTIRATQLPVFLDRDAMEEIQRNALVRVRWRTNKDTENVVFALSKLNDKLTIEYVSRT